MAVTFQLAQGRERFETSPDVLNNRGVDLLESGRNEGAQQVFEQALRLDPRHAAATYNIGLVRWRAAQITDADLRRELEAVGALDPKGWQVRLLLAQTRLEAGDCQNAVDILENTECPQDHHEKVQHVLQFARDHLANSRRRISTLPDPKDQLEAIAISSDGRYVVTGGLRTWEQPAQSLLMDVTSLTIVRAFSGYYGRISEDGRCVLTRTERKAEPQNDLSPPNETLSLWDSAHEGQCQAFDTSNHFHTQGLTRKKGTSSGHSTLLDAEVTAVALSSNGSCLVAGHGDGRLQFWNTTSGACRQFSKSNESKDSIRQVCLTPDAQYVIAAYSTDGISVWDTGLGRCVLELKDYRGDVDSLAVSPDGKYLLSGHSGCTVRWIDEEGGNTSESTSSESAVRLWDLGTGRCLRVFEGPDAGTKTVWFGRDGRLAVAGAGGGNLCAWALDSGECVCTVRSPLSSSVFSGGGSLVAIGGDVPGRVDEWKLEFWSLETGECLSGTALPHKPCALAVDAENRKVLINVMGGRAEAGSVQIWNATTGTCLRSFDAHKRSVSAVCFSPDGRLVFTGGGSFGGEGDYHVVVWDFATTERKGTLVGHRGKITGLYASADNRWLWSSSHDHTVRLWNLETGECVRVLGETKEANLADAMWGGAITSFSVLPGGHRLVTGSNDGACRWWDVDTGALLHTSAVEPGHHPWVSATPDGRYVLLVTTPLDGKARDIKCLDPVTGNCMETIEVGQGCLPVGLYGANGRVLVVSHPARLIEISTGRCLCTLPNGTARSAVAREGFYVQSEGDYDSRSIGVFDLRWNQGVFIAPFERNQVLSAIEQSQADAAVNRTLDDALRAFRQRDFVRSTELVRAARTLPGRARYPRAVRLWQELYKHFPRQSLRDAWVVRTLHAGEGLQVVCLTEDGRFALCGGSRGTLSLWDLAAGSCIREWKAHREGISTLCVSPDGRIALSGCRKLYMSGGSGGPTTQCKLWDLQTGSCLRALPQSPDGLNAACFSPDGAFAITAEACTNDGPLAQFLTNPASLQLWHVHSGRLLRRYVGGVSQCYSLALTPDGRYALAGNDDGFLLWELASGFSFGLQPKRGAGFGAVARMCPDGRQAVSGYGNLMRVWGLATLECLKEIEIGNDDLARCVSMNLTADGRYGFTVRHQRQFTALGGPEGPDSFQLWDLHSGRPLHTFVAHKNPVSDMCASRDGRKVVSIDTGGEIKVWLLDWDLETPPSADREDTLRPILETFLTLHTSYQSTLPAEGTLSEDLVRQALTRRGKPEWTKRDLRGLRRELGSMGYGSIELSRLQTRLRELAKGWQRPPELLSLRTMMHRAMVNLRDKLVFRIRRLWERE